MLKVQLFCVLWLKLGFTWICQKEKRFFLNFRCWKKVLDKCKYVLRILKLIIIVILFNYWPWLGHLPHYQYKCNKKTVLTVSILLQSVVGFYLFCLFVCFYVPLGGSTASSGSFEGTVPFWRYQSLFYRIIFFLKVTMRLVLLVWSSAQWCLNL